MTIKDQEKNHVVTDVRLVVNVLDELLSRWKVITPPPSESDIGAVEEIAQDLQEILVPLDRAYQTIVRAAEMKNLARRLRPVGSRQHSMEDGNLVRTQQNLLKLIYHLRTSITEPSRNKEIINMLAPKIGMDLQTAFEILTKVLSGLSSSTSPLKRAEIPKPSNVKLRQVPERKVPAFDAYALLVGVGDYLHPRFSSLPVTVSDAQAIAAILTNPARCGYPTDNVQVTTGEQATAANIRTALQSLAQSTNSQSTVFLYFSGHGGRALENGAWRAYLCPREADPNDLAHTAIPGDEFSALLAAIPARKLLVILDACHAAGSAELKAADGTVMWKSGLPDDYYQALSRGSGRVIIASSKEDQLSYVRGELSLFTKHLVQALNGKAAVRGDGLIHVLDVFHHVNEAVQADEPKQVPILKVKDLDLNFPIALDRGGKGTGPAISPTPIADIREQIVRDPIGGAKALSDYLQTRAEWVAKRNEVDLKRADLERIQHDLDLFGPNPADQAAKNHAVYFLLRVCLELEQATAFN